MPIERINAGDVVNFVGINAQVDEFHGTRVLAIQLDDTDPAAA